MKPTMSQECCRVRARNRAKVWVQCDNTLAKDAAASQFSLPARLGIPPIRVFLGVFWGIDLRGRLAEHIGMSRWTISPARLFLLGFSLFVILLLVVLPQVDPLDTAFHRGTAPAVVHAYATSTPAILSLAVPFHFLQGAVQLEHSHEQPTVTVYPRLSSCAFFTIRFAARSFPLPALKLASYSGA